MRIAIWHHAVLRGPRIPSEEHALAILTEQMEALQMSGLADAADEIHLCVNGTPSDALTVCSLAPFGAIVWCNQPDAATELATMQRMQRWLKPGWRVLYTHAKGASYKPENAFPDEWRRCMQRAVVWGWKECMDEMDHGIEVCGCHWLTPERWGAMVKTPFFGGNFWLAKSEYLMTLPPLPPDTWENRYEAESWIGRGPRRPVIRDFHHEWPGAGCNR